MSNTHNTTSQSKIKMLRLLVYSYYGLAKVLTVLTGNTKRVVKQVIYYPTVNDEATLADLVNRISWYFPQSANSRVEVSIVVDKKLLVTNLKSLVPPSSQHCYIGKSENIHLIEQRERDLSKADAIMLWDKRSMFKPVVLRHLTKVNIVDPTFYFSVEADTHQRMCIQTLEGQQKERLVELSKKNFQALLDEVDECEQGYVFGTGPSLEAHAMDFDYSDGFRVVCNSIVKNKTLLNYIKPQLLVFGDAQHHMSPCRYAATFRQAAIEAVNELQCYILTEDYHLPLLLAHYPELKDKIIGIEAPGVWKLSLYEIIMMVLHNPHKIPWFDKIPGHDEEYNFPTPDKFYVRLTGSVLPSFMIPIVSSICKDIYILGADGRDPKGRKPDGTFIWGYSPSCQFNEQTAFDTHPSYFRDRPYTEDFDIYCENFEGLIHYGESLGRKYYSLAPSYIPVLAQRLVPDGILTKMNHK
jgi:hypothetical protein